MHLYIFQSGGQRTTCCISNQWEGWWGKGHKNAFLTTHKTKIISSSSTGGGKYPWRKFLGVSFIFNFEWKTKKLFKIVKLLKIRNVMVGLRIWDILQMLRCLLYTLKRCLLNTLIYPSTLEKFSNFNNFFFRRKCRANVSLRELYSHYYRIKT